MNKCFYKFSDKKFKDSNCDLLISGFKDNDELKYLVLSKYSVNDLTCEILEDIKDMFKDFVLQKGLYEFTLHNNKSFKFYYS